MIFFTVIATATASALHGWGKVDKLYPTLGLCLFCTLMLLSHGAEWFSLSGIIIGWLWRIVTRSGRQAHAELQAMDTRGLSSNKDDIMNVWKSHWFNPFAFVLGFVIVKWLNYDNFPYEEGDSEGERFLDTRRKVEIASGALPQAAFVILCLEGVLQCL